MKSMNQIVIVIAVAIFSITSCNGQIKNLKTENVKIFGNCSMCKTTIEKAGSKNTIAKVDWNIDSKIATITFDSTKTNQDEILKSIALSGYDSEKFLTPNDVYENLPKCCQYVRKSQTLAKSELSKTVETKKLSDVTGTIQVASQLKVVFETYFAVKDALVKTDGKTSSAKAKELLIAINSVKMEKLTNEEIKVWMQVMKDLAFDTEHIADTKDASHQRDHFMTLSKNMYDLMKVFKSETPIYYQFCPMANDGKGANWLSKEEVIKNPYYGLQMLSCGKTIETIK